MIRNNCRKGFVLPFTIILSGSIIVLVTLLFRQSRFEFKRRHIESAHSRTLQTLRINIPRAISQLNTLLAENSSVTCLCKAPDREDRSYNTCLFAKDSDTLKALGTINQSDQSKHFQFRSAVSKNQFIADVIELSPENSQWTTSFGWTIEDIALSTLKSNAPEWWPLPDWQLSPVISSTDNSDLFTQLSGREISTIAALAADEPIPYSETRSPEFTPVIYCAGLKFGFFASGDISQREKMLRIRYYLECGIWNPYNRDMQFHSRSGTEPVFQLVFRNLPRVRIINISKGVSTGWIDMDGLANSYTGLSGIHGWIRLPPKLTAGDSLLIREPDSDYQPEGLARTVHPSFMISSADEIKVEFQSKEEGIEIACIPLKTNNPITYLQDGEAWFRMKGSVMEIPDLQFDRADDPRHPFYLAGGSLSFSEAHAQLSINANRPIKAYSIRLDPRQTAIDSAMRYTDATGHSFAGADLVRYSVVKLADEISTDTEQLRYPAIISWPTDIAASLISLSDVPDWRNGYCIGAPQAVLQNRILNFHWPAFPESTLSMRRPDGTVVSYERAIPINAISPTSWLDFLQGDKKDQDPVRFALFSNPITMSDSLEISLNSLESISGRLSLLIQANPSKSIGDFFNRGILIDAIGSSSDNPLHQLLQLRALAEKGRLVDHGSSLIIHAACLTEYGNLKIIKSARVWLLEVTDENHATYYQVIHLEWTDPQEHLSILSEAQL